MRKLYLDNIRWITVVLVVFYHVIYMFNGVERHGVIGPFTEIQYQDVYQYIVYPWFMLLLFVVSGMSARFYLENHTDKEFRKSRTVKLLVPSTIGLFVFQWILGYYNTCMSGVWNTMPDEVPGIVKYLIMVVSGTGVLWYIQLLWVFSMLLLVARKLEKDRLYRVCSKTNLYILLLLTVAIWGGGTGTKYSCCDSVSIWNLWSGIFYRILCVFTQRSDGTTGKLLDPSCGGSSCHWNPVRKSILGTALCGGCST